MLLWILYPPKLQIQNNLLALTSDFSRKQKIANSLKSGFGNSNTFYYGLEVGMW